MTTSSCSSGVRYALIGCGRISPNHIAAAIENGLCIAALCDIDTGHADALIRRFSLDKVAVYTDYRQMLKQTSPALCAIATESGSHARVALDCIAVGCHVIVEKPMALSLSDADEMIARANKAGVVLSVCD